MNNTTPIWRPKGATSDMSTGIEDMTCNLCATLADNAVSKIPGVLKARVNHAIKSDCLAMESARVVANAGTTSASLIQFVEKAEYHVSEQTAATAARTVSEPEGNSGRAVTLAALLLFPLLAPIIVELFGSR